MLEIVTVFELVRNTYSHNTYLIPLGCPAFTADILAP